MPRSTTDRARRPSGVEPGGRPMVAPRRAPNSTAYRRMTASDSAGSSALISPRSWPSASTAAVAGTGGGDVVAEELGQPARVTEHVEHHPAAQGARTGVTSTAARNSALNAAARTDSVSWPAARPAPVAAA